MILHKVFVSYSMRSGEISIEMLRAFQYQFPLNYDSYIDKLWLQEVIEILDCCIKNKDSKYIERV